MTQATSPLMPSYEQTVALQRKGCVLSAVDSKPLVQPAAIAARGSRDLEILRFKGGPHAELDLEMLADGITVAGFHVEAGARTFADYAAKMLEDFGEKVRPFLQQWYEGVRQCSGFDATGMSSAPEIDDYLAGCHSVKDQ